MGSVLTPFLSVFTVHVEGRTYRFDGPRALVGSDVDVEPCRFRFRAEAAGTELTGVVVGRKDETAGLVYENPDGSRTYCLNSKIASGRFVLGRVGREPLELRSRQVALEVGTKRVDHGVKIHV
jgi:hypothetical protein